MLWILLKSFFFFFLTEEGTEKQTNRNPGSVYVSLYQVGETTSGKIFQVLLCKFFYWFQIILEVHRSHFATNGKDLLCNLKSLPSDPCVLLPVPLTTPQNHSINRTWKSKIRKDKLWTSVGMCNPQHGSFSNFLGSTWRKCSRQILISFFFQVKSLPKHMKSKPDWILHVYQKFNVVNFSFLTKTSNILYDIELERDDKNLSPFWPPILNFISSWREIIQLKKK